MKKELFFLILAFIGGVLFRLWFISLSPQPFGWDQYEYEMYAAKIFSHPWMMASHSYRSYPYPLLLALFYKVVGFGNHQAVFLLQAVMDSFVGIMIYMILRILRSRAGLIGLILYLINPFTSGYVGVLLAEVMTGFFITGTILLGMVFVKKANLVNGIMFGLFAGLAAETRNAAFVWAAIPVGLALMINSKSEYRNPKQYQNSNVQNSKQKHVLFRIWNFFRFEFVSNFVLRASNLSVCIGFLLTLLYPLVTNWREYHELNVTTVDSILARELFNGAILSRLPPFTYVYPPEVQNMYGEYYSEYDPGRTTRERKAMADKYMGKAWAIIKRDPRGYLQNRIEKMWYVWQKENIFFYTEPGFERHRMVTYWGNSALLLLAACGLWFWPKKGSFVRWSIIGTILYGTLAFSVTHAEYRLTIPFYPLLILAASVGIAAVINHVRNV